MPRTKFNKKSNKHEPLEKQIVGDPNYVKEPRKKREKNIEEEDYIPADISRKILNAAHEQQTEIMKEEEESMKNQERQEIRFTDKPVEISDDSDYEESEDDFDQENEEFLKEYQIDAGDEAALSSFFSNSTKVRTLGDIIQAKLAEQQQDTSKPVTETRLNPKIVEVYSSIGEILRHYKSGRLPKAFKIIPSLSNWEQILEITRPENWSPCAMYAATKIFASNLNAKLAQRFFNLVLLPAVQDDIANNKKLNYHYYHALKKSLYKPTAFFKGIMLPLCEAQCTLKEALIISSVLSHVSVPMVHSAAALKKMCELPYCGAISLFMRVLLNKKYSLPYTVIDSLVDHFMSFYTVEETLPVLWHQCLLTFAQRYKYEITKDQKDRLKVLMKKHFHHLITPEIRRELFTSSNRGETHEDRDVAME